MKERILCVGTDRELLESRKLVLATRGYKAEIALPDEVSSILDRQFFDLVIVSASVSREGKMRIASVIPKETCLLALDSFVMPRDLCEMIERVDMWRNKYLA